MENQNQWINWEDTPSTPKSESPTENTLQGQEFLNRETSPQEKNEIDINWDNTNIHPQFNPEHPPVTRDTNLQPIEELNPNIEEVQNNYNSTPNKENDTIDNQTPFSYLGKVNKIQLSNHLYHFNINNSQAVQDLQELNLQEIGDDCKFDFNPKPNTNLGKIIENIVKISAKKQLRIKECFLYKVPKNQSVLNISNTKSKETFIYYLQSNNKGGNVILNLSSIGGPTIPFINSSQGILNIIPGWIPYNISKNTTNEDIIFIAGTLD